MILLLKRKRHSRTDLVKNEVVVGFKEVSGVKVRVRVGVRVRVRVRLQGTRWI